MSLPLGYTRIKLSLKRTDEMAQATALQVGVFHGQGGHWTHSIAAAHTYLVCSKLKLFESWTLHSSLLKKVSISVGTSDSKRQFTLKAGDLLGKEGNRVRISPDRAVLYQLDFEIKGKSVLIKGVRMALHREYFPFFQSHDDGPFVLTQMFSRTASRRYVSCAMCDAPDAKQLCTKCKTANYCKRKCQVVHWPEHKELCARIAQALVIQDDYGESGTDGDVTK